jgi:GT2 family glycosyltransferase
MWTTRYYVRDVEDVVDEIESYVQRYAVSDVDFYDLTAIIKRDWILAFCAEIERRGLRITYQLPTGTRSEALDAEVLRALYRTGCRNICYAPESGSARTLQRIKKKVRLERMTESIRAAKRAGIVVKANLMIGFPGETRRDMWETVCFGLKLAWMGVEDLPLFPFIPYPATQLYEELRAANAVPEVSKDSLARLGYADLDGAPSFSEHVSSRQLASLRLVGMTAFLVLGYVRRPWRMVRTLRCLVSERSTTVVELRLVDLKRRLVSMLRQAVTRGTAAPASEPLPAPRPLDRRVTCVLPAYNEAASLPHTVASWDAVLSTCTNDHEILVVDDGSTDDTARVLRDLAARFARLRVVAHRANLGYGAAIAKGFARAAFPLLFFTDSDGQYDPRDFPRVLDRLPTADIVVGYRTSRADPPGRDFLSRAYNWIARRIIGVTLRDLNCAFKLMRRETFTTLGRQSTGFVVNAEMAANAARLGLEIVEVPVRHLPRVAGHTKVRPSDILTTLYGLLRLRFRGFRIRGRLAPTVEAQLIAPLAPRSTAPQEALSSVDAR